jgi:ATP phosphoribosyltransferase
MKFKIIKMSKLKIAIQKSGRLSENSLELIKECGIRFENGTGALKIQSSNFPLELFFLRDDDIPKYVEEGVADIGIVGLNTVLEEEKKIDIAKNLGFSKCRLALAIPKHEEYSGINYLQNKRIATSYPTILASYLKSKNVEARPEQISGSVEIAPNIGLADAICDIVSSGSTLMSNGLKEVEIIMKSEAVLVKNQNLKPEVKELLDDLLFRIESVLNAKNKKYILLNAPDKNLPEIIKLLPGMKSPTIMPLAEKGWSSVHSVIHEDDFWSIISQLKKLGSEGILVTNIEKIIS